MFLRRHKRTKNGKTHIYYAIVESVRTQAGPRQRVVAHLGELNHDQELRWQRTIRFHNQQGEDRQLRLFPDDERTSSPDDPDAVRINLKSVGWANPRQFGDVWLALWLWQHLKLDEILDRHIPQGHETIRPADIVAIEVINRLCSPCSEFALAEHWYAATGLEDLLGVPDSAVTKDRLYRTLDQLLKAQNAIERDLEKQLGTLFRLDYSLVLYDLTSTYFEGLAAENELAKRGYSRDHRSDCKQVVVALVVTKDGFPLAHRTFAGNTQDLKTVQTIVGEIETQFGSSQRVWVMDRGMISDESLKFLGESNRRYLLATKRGELSGFQDDLGKTGWSQLRKNSQVEVKLFEREAVHYLLARSRPRRRKERAIRRRQRRGLASDLKKLCALVDAGKLKKRDKILERVGRLKERYPKARGFVQINVTSGKTAPAGMVLGSSEVQASLGDGWGVLVTKQSGWLDGCRVLGNVYAAHAGRACLPGSEKRITLAADLAPLQRAHASSCFCVRSGVRALEDIGPPRQASRADDQDPKAGSRQASIVAQAQADDAAGDSPGAGEDQDRRHIAEHVGRTAIGPASRRST